MGLFDDIQTEPSAPAKGLFDDIPAAPKSMFDDIPAPQTLGEHPQGRGIIQALKDYPLHLLQGLLHTPEQAWQNSAFSLGTGTYDPEPAVNAAMLGGVGPSAAGVRLPLKLSPKEGAPEAPKPVEAPPAKGLFDDIPPERIDKAATRVHNDIYPGVNHLESIEAAAKSRGMSVDELIDKHTDKEAEHGFLTNSGRFVNREEALKIAESRSQIDPENAWLNEPDAIWKQKGLNAEALKKEPASTVPPPPTDWKPVSEAPAKELPPITVDEAGPKTPQNLADDLYRLRQSTVADKQEVGNAIRALPEEAKGTNIGEKLYDAREDPKLRAKLDPQEKALYNKHLQPMFDEQLSLIQRAKKLGGEDLVEDPNHMHRMAKGHTPEYDNLSGDAYDPVSGTRSLPRTTSSLQERKFYAIENPYTGVRKVVSPNEDGITVWNNRKGTSIPTGDKLKPGGTVAIVAPEKTRHGTLDVSTDWKVTQATTREIEQHGAFKGPTGSPVPAEYHKNAFVNTADDIVRLRSVVRNLEYFKDLQSSRYWLDRATKAGGNREIPKGWRTTDFPPARGWVMDPKLADVFDDFYRPGILSPDSVLRQVNRFATAAMFWNPLPHMANVGVHWQVARGWDWVRPGPLKNFATDMSRAIKAAVTQNADYQRFLKNGGGLISGGIKNADFYGDIGRHMGMDIEKNWSDYQDLFKKVGIATPAKAVAWWYEKMRNILWDTSDVFMMHRYLELERKGLSTPRAIADAEKHIPNYRIPTEIGSAVLPYRVSRGLSKAAQEPALVNFMRYHYGMWKSFMHMAVDMAKGTPAEKKEALGNVAALAFAGFAIYPVLDYLYQKTTGDPKAALLRRGAMTIPHGAAEVARNRESFSQFLGKVITPAPVTKEILEQLFGVDFFSHKDLGGVPQRVEHAAKGLVSPFNTVEMATSGATGKGLPGRTWGRSALDTLVGGENTSPRTEAGKKYAAQKRTREAAAAERNPKGLLDKAYYGTKHYMMKKFEDTLKNVR